MTAFNFTTDGQLTTTKQVVLKPYSARPFKNYTLATDDDILNGAGSNLIVDTENYLNFFLIAFKHIETGKIIKLIPPFNPQKLSWILHSYRTIGFNSIKYDMPLIWLSYNTQDLELLKEASNDLINGIWIQEFEAKWKSKVFPTSHIDLIEVCPLRGSLKLYGGRLHAPRIQDVPFNPYGDLTPEQIDIVSDYCVNDLDITELLLNNLKEQLKLRENLSAQYRQNLMSKSDAQIAEAVISSEIKQITGKWPKKPKIDTETIHKFQVPNNLQFQTPVLKQLLNVIANADFKLDPYGRLEVPDIIKNRKIQIGNAIYRIGIGGLHSSEENVSYKSNEQYQIFDRDVAGYYPAIVLNCKLFPKHLGEIFLEIYKSINDRRLAAKRAKNIAESENLKVTANGTFGKTGSPHSVLYAPEMTIQITVGGQLYLLMQIEAMELNGIQVISANTDGILIYCPKDKYQTYLDIISQWEKQTGFVTEETKYVSYYARDINAYMAIKEPNKDGVSEIKGKNVYYDPWRGKSAKDAYWRFQKNPTAQICIEAIENLILKNKPIEETINEDKNITKFICVKNVTGGAHKNGEYLGKVIRWYISKTEIGTINYIKSGNKVPETEGARPCLDLPKQFPTDINYKYYIDRTTGLLEDMDYIKKPKQIKFF